MAKKKINKRTKKKIRKFFGKHPVLSTVAVLLVVAITAACFLHYERYIHIAFLDPFLPQKQEAEIVYTDEDLQFHFIELGKKF